jgi:hypothetical protein
MLLMLFATPDAAMSITVFAEDILMAFAIAAADACFYLPIGCSLFAFRLFMHTEDYYQPILLDR